MKVIWKILAFLAILVAIAIGGVIGKEAGLLAVNKHDAAGNDASIENALREASNRANESLPMMVDRNTRLDATSSGPGKTWTYLFTRVSLDSPDVSQRHPQDLITDNVWNGVCTSMEMQIFVNRGVRIVYRYRDSDGNVIRDVVIDSQDCQ